MRGRGTGAGPVGPGTLTAAAAAAGLAGTLLVSLTPYVRFAYRSVPAHAALETVDALAASVVAFVAYGRARRGALLGDTLLATALALLGAGDLFFALIPALLGTTDSLAFGTWAPIAIRLTAATALALAALAVAGAPRPMSPAATRALLAVLAVLAAVVAGLWVVRSRLPLALDPTLAPDASRYPHVTGQPVALALQLVQTVPYAVAAVAFTARAGRAGDRLAAWLGAGCALGAFARLNYFLFPSIFSQWVCAGDLLRTLCYLSFLVGAGYEVRGYWAAQAEAAVFAERRRLARDLHDGAVQEIGYVRSLAARRAAAGDAESESVVAAAERALAEMRAALSALTVRLDEPLAETLRRAACEVADRYDVPVEFVGDQVPAPSHPQREALVRIVREAVSNAVRHGRAARVRVELRSVPTPALVVRDDGTGFDPGATGGRGFGLVSMRDRAEAIGGRLSIESAPGAGTVVAVTW